MKLAGSLISMRHWLSLVRQHLALVWAQVWEARGPVVSAAGLPS